MKKKTVIFLIVLLLIALLIVWMVIRSGKRELLVQTAVVTEGSIELTVMATGYVQPVDQVEVGTQVSGVIEKIYVDFNSHVKRGQLLAELDKLTLLERQSQANASLRTAQSNLLYAQQNYDRTKTLYDQKAATLVAYEAAVNSLEQARNTLADAQANVQQADVNLGYANITSPIDGIVLDRAVEEGQTVAASFNTPTLFTIANDLTKMQVEADVDEADIGRVKLGQRVTFTVDAYNYDTFEGTVEQIRLQPVVTNNVVTYTVIIDAPNPDEKLFPGMTANITIVTETDTGMTIPVEALTFRMTPEIEKELAHVEESGETAQPTTGRNGNSRGNVVWVKQGDTYIQRTIQTGIDDGINTIVRSGLTGGQEVVLSASMEKKSRNADAAANPLMPRRPGRR